MNQNKLVTISFANLYFKMKVLVGDETKINEIFEYYITHIINCATVSFYDVMVELLGSDKEVAVLNFCVNNKSLIDKLDSDIKTCQLKELIFGWQLKKFALLINTGRV